MINMHFSLLRIVVVDDSERLRRRQLINQPKQVSHTRGTRRKLQLATKLKNMQSTIANLPVRLIVEGICV